MKPHHWVIEEVDSGYLGMNDCWLCSACGAAGGPVFYTAGGQPGSPRLCFYPRRPQHLDLPDDCEEAARLIKETTCED